MLLGERIISAHVRNQNPLGSTSLCFSRCARLSLGSHRMDFLATGFSAATWTALVLDRALADLSATRLLHLVVQIRRLRTEDFCRGWEHRRKRRNRGHGRYHHDVGLARERSPALYDVWLGPMGRSARGSAGRTSRA